MVAFGILVAMVSRGFITAQMAHEILDGQALLLEELSLPKAGYSPEQQAHISAGLKDLSYLRQMLQASPHMRLPD